jgi:hypothetical protein
MAHPSNRIEMELVLVGKRIEFSPTCAEVTDMIVSVVHEMNKLLREVPTIQSWITGASNQFVQVTLNKVKSVGKWSQYSSEARDSYKHRPNIYKDTKP